MFASVYDLDALPLPIRERITVDTDSGCWVSDRNIDRDGYSRTGGEGTHRVVWKLLVGEIPAGLVLDHVKARGCVWNCCVNPAHLEPVTQRENTLRGHSFAAVNAAKTRCDNGHEYTPENTYRWRNRRDCRACIRARVRKYQHGLRRSHLVRAA